MKWPSNSLKVIGVMALFDRSGMIHNQCSPVTRNVIKLSLHVCELQAYLWPQMTFRTVDTSDLKWPSTQFFSLDTSVEI